jgi:uncharacterized protein HemY
MLKNNEVDAAQEHVARLLEVRPDSAEALYIKAKILFKKFLFNEAILSFE